MFGIGTFAFRCQPIVLSNSSTRAPLGSVAVQPTATLKTCCSSCGSISRVSNSGINFPRPLVASPSPLKEVEILYICLVVFLSSSVPCCADIRVRFLRDSQRCFVVCSLPRLHLSLPFKFICASFAANGPCRVRKWTISGVGSWSFLHREHLDIFHASIGSFLFRAIYQIAALALYTSRRPAGRGGDFM